MLKNEMYIWLSRNGEELEKYLWNKWFCMDIKYKKNKLKLLL
jgi:hypothetical protein